MNYLNQIQDINKDLKEIRIGVGVYKSMSAQDKDKMVAELIKERDQLDFKNRIQEIDNDIKAIRIGVGMYKSMSSQDKDKLAADLTKERDQYIAKFPPVTTKSDNVAVAVIDLAGIFIAVIVFGVTIITKKGDVEWFDLSRDLGIKFINSTIYSYVCWFGRKGKESFGWFGGETREFLCKFRVKTTPYSKDDATEVIRKDRQSSMEQGKIEIVGKRRAPRRESSFHK